MKKRVIKVFTFETLRFFYKKAGVTNTIRKNIIYDMRMGQPQSAISAKSFRYENILKRISTYDSKYHSSLFKKNAVNPGNFYFTEENVGAAKIVFNPDIVETTD